ncbi:radical SAM protein [Clostridium chromiireducens]|uniref:Radical SAM protein n=1 Tax=Clostridium chromiireducens TaxID=225345 RepID=A0A964RMD0_9CLOT|nr:radical SAM protein [Clostridium chromiireducens]MVX64211.1 radical SAM protein [Clostridium chromiireducens]
MYYKLNNGVYFVNGKVKSCIYDLNESKLYSINKLLAEKVNQINKGQIRVDYVDEELKKVLDGFVVQGLIKMSELPETHQIDEIKEDRSRCKFAWIEITSKCNLRCIHCYNESDIRCDNIMSLSQFKQVIDILLEMEVPKIQIIGGEPFYDKTVLRNMLDYTVGKFEYIEIFTNGTLVPEMWFDYLAENNIHIALSVYSYNPEMHDLVTGIKGSLERTNKTIEELKRNGISYRVCNVLMKDIELGEKTNDLYTLSEEKDVVRMSGRANFNLLSDELIKKKLITKKSFQKPIKRAFCKRLISGHNCFSDKIYISANMEVFPCVMERRMKHCVIDEHKKIILDDNIRYFTKDKVNECSECEYRYACFDCRPNSLSENIYEKPWYCTYNPRLAEWEDEDTFIAELRNNWDETTESCSQINPS